MSRVAHFAVSLLIAFFCLIAIGCSQNYEPDPADVPEIPPGTKQAPGATGEGEGGFPLPPSN